MEVLLLIIITFDYSTTAILFVCAVEQIAQGSCLRTDISWETRKLWRRFSIQGVLVALVLVLDWENWTDDHTRMVMAVAISWRVLVSSVRHYNSAGCGTSKCRIPCTEMPWLFFPTFLPHCPLPSLFTTKRDYTFLINHLWCALGFLSVRIGFLEVAPTPACRRFQSIFTKCLSDKREIWQTNTVTIFLCHLRPAISIIGKYLKHFNDQCDPPFTCFWFSHHHT